MLKTKANLKDLKVINDIKSNKEDTESIMRDIDIIHK